MPNYKRRNTQPNDMFVCRHKNVHENRKRKIMQWVLVMSDIRDSVFSSSRDIDLSTFVDNNINNLHIGLVLARQGFSLPE